MIFLFQIVCVLLLVGCGFLARRRGMLSAQGTNDLAHVALALVYPALILVSITELSFADLRANLSVPLLAIPLLPWIPLSDPARGILVIIAVMPSAMVSVLFSERYGGDTDFIAGGLLLTHLWALVTVPLFLAWAF